MESPAEPRRAWIFAPLLVGVIGLLIAHHPMFADGFSRVQGDRGDARLNNYLLEHAWRWLTGDPRHASLWGPPIFFPVKNALAFGDVLLGFGPIYWIWRALGAAPDTAFQLWMVTGSALSYAAAYALVRRGFGFSAWPAALGANLIAFGAPHVAQIGHAQLLPSFYTSLAILGVARIFDPSATARMRRAWMAIACASAVLQVWSAFYPAWFLALGGSFAIIVALVSRAMRARLVEVIVREWPALLVCAAVSALLVAPLAARYAEVARAVGPRIFERDVRPLLPVPAAWLYLGDQSWLYGWFSKLPIYRDMSGLHERRLGIGPLTSALVLLGLAWRRRTAAGALAAAVLAMIVILPTLFGDEFTLWHVLALFPAGDAIRAVSRIALIALVPAAFGLAAFFEDARRPGRIAIALLALACVLEQGQTTDAYDKREVRASTAALTERIAHLPPDTQAFFYERIVSRDSPTLGRDDAALFAHTEAMWASMDAGIPTINGWAGNRPPGWEFIWTRPEFPGDEPETLRSIFEWCRASGLPIEHVRVVREPK